MPALSFHVATPELQYPTPFLFRSPLHAASDIGYGSKIDTPVDAQAAQKEIIDQLTKSIQLLQESSCADPEDADSACSSHTHSSMPPLEELSVSSSDSGSDMDLESVHSDSRRLTTTRDPEELAQVERDIFGGSESSFEEIYEGPHPPNRLTRSWVTNSEISSELSEDRIIDDWDRIPVQEDEPIILSDDNMSTYSADESIIESIAQDAYKAVLRSVSVFLETESFVMDISQCKFKNGRSPELRNSMAVSANLATATENPVPRQEDYRAPETKNTEISMINQLGFGNVDSPAQYLARMQPPAYLSTLPRYMQHRPFLRELKGLRRRVSEVIEAIIYSLDTEDWGIVMDESLDILVEHGDAFRELTMRKKDYYREFTKCKNALILEKEDHFLRNSASRFRARGRLDLHDAVLDILQVRTRHPKIVQQLLTAGYLEPAANDHAALHMPWIFERMGYSQ